MADVFRSDYFKDSECIAGGSSLDNLVTSINIVDTPFDYLRFQRKDSFVMVAGWVQHFETEKKRRELLTNLQEVGIAGIGIYSYEFESGYPEDLLKSADELNLPVITLSESQDYTNVVKYFAEHIYIPFYKTFQQKDEVKNLFFKSVYGDKLNYIASKLWELSATGVYIRFYEEQYNYRNIDVDLILHNQDLWNVSKLSYGKLNKYRDIYQYNLSVENQEYHWMGFHEREHGNTALIFWLFLEDECDEQDLQLYYYAYRAMYQEFEKRDIAYFQESEKQLTYLLDKKRQHKSKYMRGTVQLFSQPLPADHLVDINALINDFIAHTSESCGGYTMGNYQGHFTLVLFDFSSKEDEYQLCERILKYWRERLGKDENLYVGIGKNMDTAELDRSHTYAKSACLWANKSNRAILTYKDLDVLGLIDSESGIQMALELVEELVVPLKNHDKQNDTSLLPSMRAYVQNAWNYSQASESLYVHANTVKYRIKKSKVLLNCEFEEYAERLKIEMGIRIADILKLDK
jgi:purine catabolism regulator